MLKKKKLKGTGWKLKLTKKSHKEEPKRQRG